MQTKREKARDSIKRFYNLKRDIMNYFYEIFLNKFKINGISDEANEFVFKEFWRTGKITGFYDKDLDQDIFTPFAERNYNLYDFPIYVNLIRLRNATFVPTGPQKVHRDVEVCYILKSRRPIYELVDIIAEKIVDAEILLDQNNSALKLPFLITGPEEAKERLSKLVDDIIAGLDTIYLTSNDAQNIKVLLTGVPFNQDKIFQYKKARENEGLTRLGVNNIDIEKKEHLIVDEANANNALIEDNANNMYSNLEAFIVRYNQLFNRSLSVIDTSSPVDNNEENEEDEEDAQ